MTATARFAVAAPAPVFPIVGAGMRCAVEDLSLSDEISLVSSPRHAGLLLVAGAVRPEDRPAVLRLHDQLPHPRATLWWGAAPDADIADPLIADAGAGADPASMLAAAHRALLDGRTASESHWLPDEPPAPWRGKGDHGQGGEGMMGGTPYGRPMAMTGDDLRDGLALDAYSARLGPFLPMFPPGLVIEATLQGDVIRSAAVRRPPFPQDEAGCRGGALRSIARMLRVLGLPAVAERFLAAAAAEAAGRTPDLRALRRALFWSGAVRAVPPDLHGARDRLRLWWRAVESGGAPARAGEEGRDRLPESLDAMLPGLEWTEAVLLINSFDNAVLRRLCGAGEET